MNVLERSSLALYFTAGCSNLSNIFCLVTLVILVHYFNKDSNHAIDIKLKIFGILPIVTSIILNIWFGMLGNNSLWTPINDKFPFIDEYCLESMRFVLGVEHIDLYAISIFILMRTYYSFDTVKVNPFIYYVLIFILSIIAVLFCVLALTVPSDLFQVTIYHNNNNKQKQCELSFNTRTPNYQPLLALSQTLIQFCVVILCLKKFINFNQFVSKQKGKIPKSNIPIDVVTRLLALSITFIMTYWFSFVISILYQWSFFPCVIMIKISIIMGSFNIKQKTYVLSVYRNTNTPKTIYKRIENNKIKTNNSILLDDVSDMSSTTHIHIQCDHEIQWGVDNKFQRDCINIYNNILSSISISECVAQLISEYASTQYLHCIQCFGKYGFIECHLDYDRISGVMAVFDEYNNVRYYLDNETSRITECDLYNKYDENMEILCVKCSAKTKCTHCGNILTSIDDMYVNECITCKALICEMCIDLLLCELEGDTYVLCEDCMNNDNVTCEQISSLVKSSLVKYSNNKHSNNNTEISLTNDWTNWNFQGAF